MCNGEAGEMDWLSASSGQHILTGEGAFAKGVNGATAQPTGCKDVFPSQGKGGIASGVASISAAKSPGSLVIITAKTQY